MDLRTLVQTPEWQTIQGGDHNRLKDVDEPDDGDDLYHLGVRALFEFADKSGRGLLSRDDLNTFLDALLIGRRRVGRIEWTSLDGMLAFWNFEAFDAAIANDPNVRPLVDFLLNTWFIYSGTGRDNEGPKLAGSRRKKTLNRVPVEKIKNLLTELDITLSQVSFAARQG